MALLLGGPWDGELMEVTSPHPTLTLRHPGEDDAFTYVRETLVLLGQPLYVWRWSHLRGAWAASAGRHVLTQLGMALLAEAAEVNEAAA